MPRPRTSASRRHPDDDPAPRRPVNGHGKVDQCWCPASRARRSSADQSDGCGQRRVRAGERHQREDSDPGGGSSQGRGPSRPRRATRSLPAVVRPLHAPGLLAGLSLRGPKRRCPCSARTPVSRRAEGYVHVEVGFKLAVGAVCCATRRLPEEKDGRAVGMARLLAGGGLMNIVGRLFGYVALHRSPSA